MFVLQVISQMDNSGHHCTIERVRAVSGRGTVTVSVTKRVRETERD